MRPANGHIQSGFETADVKTSRFGRGPTRYNKTKKKGELERGVSVGIENCRSAERNNEIYTR